ncbi:MAG: hypothetical protein ACW99U_05225 [Candidatus Thorarchaeota archaeon]|jgi:hypothetical protein
MGIRLKRYCICRTGYRAFLGNPRFRRKDKSGAQAQEAGDRYIPATEDSRAFLLVVRKEDTQTMLKEVFVISEGLLILHYSSDKTRSEDDRAVMSSGLLTAIQDFSAHTRSDVLESFSTENEYFIFAPDSEGKRVVVGVFDRRAQIPIARTALEKTIKLLSRIDMPADPGLQLIPEIKDRFREQIETLSQQLFGTEQIVSFVDDLLSKRSDIPLAFIVDAEEKKAIAKFARPRPLFKDSHVNEFLLMHSTLCKTLSSLGIGDSYAFFTLCSSEYTVASCWSGKLLSVASGAMRTREQSVLEAAVNLCYHESVNSLAGVSDEPKLSSRLVLKKNGNVEHLEGEEILSLGGIALSTLVNNLDGFFRALNRRVFTRFEVVTDTKPAIELRLERDKAGDVQVSILSHVTE